jgi:hypothetical protein
VPVAPVFAAAAEVREGKDAAALEPDGAADGEGRGQADVEAAVAVEEGFAVSTIENSAEELLYDLKEVEERKYREYLEEKE